MMKCPRRSLCILRLIGKPAHTLDLDVLNIQVHDLDALETCFTEQEVWDAICSLPADKAPGPDGFIALFYQQCWAIIKSDVMAAIHKLGSLAGNSFARLNQALITLLPKKLEPQGVKDYRPISLIHSFAKIFSKILAVRVAPIMATIIAPNQSAFITTRSIQDNFFLVR